MSDNLKLTTQEYVEKKLSAFTPGPSVKEITSNDGTITVTPGADGTVDLHADGGYEHISEDSASVYINGPTIIDGLRIYKDSTYSSTTFNIADSAATWMRSVHFVFPADENIEAGWFKVDNDLAGSTTTIASQYSGAIISEISTKASMGRGYITLKIDNYTLELDKSKLKKLADFINTL